jgi:hypothetical protein
MQRLGGWWKRNRKDGQRMMLNQPILGIIRQHWHLQSFKLREGLDCLHWLLAWAFRGSNWCLCGKILIFPDDRPSNLNLFIILNLVFSQVSIPLNLCKQMIVNLICLPIKVQCTSLFSSVTFPQNLDYIKCIVQKLMA